VVGLRWLLPPAEVIVLAVRWYLRFALSYPDVEELLAGRAIEVDHVTIYRWVQRFTRCSPTPPGPADTAVGDRWQVDATSVKAAGRWREVYRAVDQFGQVIYVFVAPRRDTATARRFVEWAIGTTRSHRSRSPATGQQRIRRCSMTCRAGGLPEGKRPQERPDGGAAIIRWPSIAWVDPQPNSSTSSMQPVAGIDSRGLSGI
jgi:DDE domain